MSGTLKLWLVMVVAQACLGSDCDLELPALLKMSVTGEKNSSGHWISQVSLKTEQFISNIQNDFTVITYPSQKVALTLYGTTGPTSPN